MRQKNLPELLNFRAPDNIRPVSDVQVSPRKRDAKVPHGRRTRKAKGPQLVDAIIDGERVLLAVNPEPLEKGIEIQIRVALDGLGSVMCMKHAVDNRNLRTGLGLGVADLICIVGPYGRFCAIEVKRPSTRNAKRDELQRRWMKRVRECGGIAGVATCVAEALALVALARRLP